MLLFDQKHYGEKQRTASIESVKALNALVREKIENFFGQAGWPAFGVEIEFHAVMRGRSRSQFPISAELRSNAFNPAIVLRFHDEEPELDGSITHIDGSYAKQLEIDLSYERSGDGKKPGRIRTPLEQGRILEVLPRIVEERAQEYSLSKVDRRTRALDGKTNLSNAIHFNSNIILEDGSNGFADDNDLASKLCLCFIEASLNFARDGGILLYAPTAESLLRYNRAIDGPTSIRLGDRRRNFGIGAGLIRGRKYNTERDGQRFDPEVEGGNLRYEDRLGSAQSVGEVDQSTIRIGAKAELVDPSAPYRFVEMHLMMMQEAFAIYEKRERENTLDSLTAESLMSRDDAIPTVAEDRGNLEEVFLGVIDSFRTSDYMKKLFGSERQEEIANMLEQNHKIGKNNAPSTVTRF